MTKKLAKKDQPIKLTMETIHKMDSLNNLMRAVKSELILASASRTAFLKEIDPKGQLSKYETSLAKLNAELKDTSDKYTKIVNEIETKFGIILKEYAYDDETGILNKLT